MVFPDYAGVMDLEENTREVKDMYQRLCDISITGDVHIDHLVKVVSARMKFLFSPFIPTLY